MPDSILAVNDTIDFAKLVMHNDIKLTKRFVVNIIRCRKQMRQLAKLNCNLDEQTSKVACGKLVLLNDCSCVGDEFRFPSVV